MKYRSGFVSNSSSTSFTVAFVPEKDDLNLKTFEFLLGAHGNNAHPVSLEVFKNTAAERRESLKDELKTYKRDKVWLKEHIEKLIECVEIPAVNFIMSELESFYQDKERMIENIRYARRAAGKHKWEDTLKNHIHKYRETILDIEQSIEKINAQIKLIKDLPDDTIVAKWTQNAGSSLLTNLLDLLREDNRVIILEQHTD